MRAAFEPAPRALRRRALLALTAGALPGLARADQGKTIVVAFANITEDPATPIEGTGFTGPDVRTSFLLAARRRPIDLVLYDNAMDRSKALASAKDAVARRVDVYVAYGWDEAVSGEIGRVLAEAEIPVLAVGRPVPGAPLYGADNRLAGRIAGEALTRFAAANWTGGAIHGVTIGPAADRINRLAERVAGVAEGLQPVVAQPARLDTGGNPLRAEALITAFLNAHSGQKVLVAALDDETALSVRNAVDTLGRHADVVIVSHGCDHTVHGNTSEHKELDPTNRGSILLGSVAFFLDRYGYDVLPLAMRLATHEAVPAFTATAHELITPENAFRIYPPIDMN